MKYILSLCFLALTLSSYAQDSLRRQDKEKNNFKFIELKFHFGSFLKSQNVLSASGLLDNGYGGVTGKVGWQPTDPKGWASRYGYPSYGVGFYSGFLSDAEVFGNPNAIYAFIRFPLSNPDKKNIFSIEPSFGLTYKLNPYNSDTNPLNTAIGARGAVYFNLDFGWTYKWTRELDILYGFDFSHFSNGSTFKPNNGLNLLGLNVGVRYNYNATQLKVNNDLYATDVLPARFKRPASGPIEKTPGNAISVYAAGGLAQDDALIGTSTLLGVFTGIVDYEHQFNEMHAITGGLDLFYDARFQERDISDRWLKGIHVGYDFRFYRFTLKMQVGTYLGDDKGKGSFFMRPAMRYDLSRRFFAQFGLKTLDGGSADYIEYGIGYRPFSW